jgi:predicted MPP superfamily phosphohydrolase
VTLAATYACWVEPTRLDVTRITVRLPGLNGCPPLRLLHISDLHVERITARERRLLDLVEELAPDMIVLTGDYLNISYTRDPTAMRQARIILGGLNAPAGVYAIKGSPSVDPPDVLAQLLDGLGIVWLRDQTTSLQWHGCHLQITGAECSYDIDADERKLRGLLNGCVSDAVTLLLYHTPDVMPIAAQTGVDLYLAGHTHGGQLRLPVYGALVTASIYGKRYEMGQYRDGDTLLYVNRGVGLEGKGAPRARFLCSPEIALFTLVGDQV